MAIIEGVDSIKVGGGYMGEEKFAVAQYDFARDGGAIGTITLLGDSIPSGAIITDSMIITDTIFTSGGAATVSVGAETAADLVAVSNFNATPFSTATPKRGALTATSTPVKTTAVRPIVATVAAAALTAGKFRVIVTYIEAP